MLVFTITHPLHNTHDSDFMKQYLISGAGNY